MNLSLFPGLDPENWKKSCDGLESVESKYACPVNNCSKHGNEAIKWKHGGNCGGGLRLYSNGKEKCQKCGVEEYFCLWDCSCIDTSKNKEQYSYSKIKNILSHLVGMDTKDVSPTFILLVAMSIDNQYHEYPERFAE